MNEIQQIAALHHLKPSSVSAVIKLLDEGNTIPFLARYRKEATGGLDEGQLRSIQEELSRLRALDERRGTILKTIRESGKLTPALEAKLKSATSRTELEDLYLPYKPSRKTRASAARDLGLDPLAELILAQESADQDRGAIAQPFLSEQVTSVHEAYQGANDIVAEVISISPEIRKTLRERALKAAKITTTKKKKAEDPRGVYQDYYQFEGQVSRLRPHQILAINRAEKEKVLGVKLSLAETIWREVLEEHFRPNPDSALAGDLKGALEDSANRLLLPAIFRDVRRQLTEKAEQRALGIFEKNLRALLLQPPLAGYTVLGLDPGFRTGCKVAVIDPTGKPLDTATIYPVPPRSQVDQARKTLLKLIGDHGVNLIVIGNGTASRETETFVAGLVREMEGVSYLITSEAGASVYSASKLAGRELPEMDVSLRGAVSIARRVQDPLAELVKIDPQSLGVGMYQHDVNQTVLKEKLGAVVESVVNQVGVEINTASPALLSFVSGIGPGLADRIVSFRDQHGTFARRGDLLDVPGMGEKTYQQAAGFLRIRDGKDPLDSTAIHPESYPAARDVIQQAGIILDQEPEKKEKTLIQFSKQRSAEDLASRLKVGVPTLVDIFKQLIRPGRDPREDLPKPITRVDVMSLDDLVEGMELRGTVANVVEFGAFINLGVKNDGLLHRSQIPQGRDLNLGDIIQVKILSVDKDRGRISLGWAGD